jgi:GT2 family glycosyltransferase
MIQNNVAVVVTFNKLNMLKECLSALLSQTTKLDGIVVFDNGSTDETQQYLSQINDKRVHSFFSKVNLGGAGGFNHAMKEAMKLDPTAIWIMDDDSIVSQNALEELIKAKNSLNNNFGFLSSNVLWTDSTPCLMNIPGVDKVWNEKMNEGLVRLNRASFVSFFVNADAIKTVGYPISEFFIWGDDIEFSQRVSNKFPCYFVPKSTVTHKMKENTEVNILNDSKQRIPRYYFDIRNKFYRFRKKGVKELTKFILQTFLLLLKIIFKKNKFKLKKIFIVLKGFFAGCFFNPEIEWYEENSQCINSKK